MRNPSFLVSIIPPLPVGPVGRRQEMTGIPDILYFPLSIFIVTYHSASQTSSNSWLDLIHTSFSFTDLKSMLYFILMSCNQYLISASSKMLLVLTSQARSCVSLVFRCSESKHYLKTDDLGMVAVCLSVFPMQRNEMQQIDSAKATGACRTSDIHLGFLGFSFFPSPARLLYHTNLMTLQCYSALEMGSLI